MWRLFQLMPLVLCLLLVGRANIRRCAGNAAIAVGLLVVGTALLFFALTFLPDSLFRDDPFPGDFLRRSPVRLFPGPKWTSRFGSHHHPPCSGGCSYLPPEEKP